MDSSKDRISKLYRVSESHVEQTDPSGESSGRP